MAQERKKNKDANLLGTLQNTKGTSKANLRMKDMFLLSSHDYYHCNTYVTAPDCWTQHTDMSYCLLSMQL